MVADRVAAHHQRKPLLAVSQLQRSPQPGGSRSLETKSELPSSKAGHTGSAKPSSQRKGPSALSLNRHSWQPSLGSKFLPGHDHVPVLQKKDKKLERLLLEFDFHTSSEKLAGLRNHLEHAKAQCRSGTDLGRHTNPLGRVVYHSQTTPGGQVTLLAECFESCV